MSDANIPLLTDIVAEPDEKPAKANTAANRTTSNRETSEAVSADVATDSTAAEDPFVVFEADDSRAGDTATHFVPSVDVLQDSLSFDEYEIMPASLHLSLEDELPGNSIAIDDVETVVAELQTRIASHVYELTDELMRAAFADLEARVFRQISTNLRQQLPELIDSVVREHLLERNQRSGEGE